MLTLDLQTGGVVNGKGHLVFVKDILSNVAVVCLEDLTVSGGRALIGETIDMNTRLGALQPPLTIVINSATEDETSSDSSVSSGLMYAESRNTEDEARYEDANDDIASAAGLPSAPIMMERPGLEPNRTLQENEGRAPGEQAPEQSETAIEHQTHANGIPPAQGIVKYYA
ncbi:hypothetical protein HYPSUDRAFT_59939 [Hypholoma sublateritium FD-334 SS-4]|uniref:Uncharacterized protein n=1 Tax=Hypholoma sublateritium (strain FD-334 SS-4) TaxID=945553 RepID=A0A0D2N2A6_HYPSF|nr:hypothetical protein HYPSUDRAFT_59939 [Hypholoma sublateritium FD-334 SS-4]